jgi:hypothetical protein
LRDMGSCRLVYAALVFSSGTVKCSSQ